MARHSSPFSAAASAAGYFYQARLALFLCLPYVNAETNIEVAIERLDDISFASAPPPPSVAPCKSCSLLGACRPTAFRARCRSVASWIAGRLAENDIPGDPL